VLDPLKQLLRVQQRRAELKEQYDYWMSKALEEGYSATKIASELHVTEAAVRMYRKRNNL